MSTVGNSHTEDDFVGSRGNHLVGDNVSEETVTDPTLGNGDGTYNVDVGDVKNIDNSEQVIGVTWDGAQRARVNSVSGNTVEIMFQEPDGGGNFSTTSDGSITGDLEVRVQH